MAIKDNKSNYKSIALSGDSGTGKGATNKILSEKLGFPIISAGNLMRAEADRLGISLVDLKKKTSGDQFLDYWLDTATRLAIVEHTERGVIIEGRLVAFTIPEGVFKVLLVIEDENGNFDYNERYRRVASRDKISLEEAEKVTKYREENMDNRYKEFYGLSYKELFDKDLYHVVVNTRNNSPEKVAEIILEAYNNFLECKLDKKVIHRTLPIFEIE